MTYFFLGLAYFQGKYVTIVSGRLNGFKSRTSQVRGFSPVKVLKKTSYKDRDKVC